MSTSPTSRRRRCGPGWIGLRAGAILGGCALVWLCGIASAQDEVGAHGPAPEPAAVLAPAAPLDNAATATPVDESTASSPPPTAASSPTVGDVTPAAGAADPERLPLGVPAAAGTSGPSGPQAGATSLVPDSSDLAPTLIALAGVVGLIALLAAGLRLARGGRGASIDTSRAPSGILEVLGRYPISGGATLLLLRAHRRILLISQSRASRLGGSTLTTLAEFDGPEDVAAVLAQSRDARDESISARFSSLLAGFSAEHATPERLVDGEVLIEHVPEHETGGRGHAHEPPVVEVRRRAAGSLLRRRLDDLRAWEGPRA